MQLSDEEREHIRLTEEYRAEVRAKLHAPRESLSDRLSGPIVVLLATALVSGLLVPWVLGRVEDKRRAFELQSQLIEQIVADDDAAQINLYLFHATISDYMRDLLKNELDKKLSAVHKLDAEERKALHEDLLRIRKNYKDAHVATLAGITKSYIEQRGNAEKVRLHYGDKAKTHLETYAKASQDDSDAEVGKVVAYQDKLKQIHRAAAAQLRGCPDESACQKIFDDAEARMTALRSEQPEFKAWEDAKRELVTFISETRPRI
ncbi:MAG TPA: hypothetical protein VNI54_15270 [Thermoanaerobaculia bacterium]|nr:hypothetical protein [Thermoanaerobaculia bacterium]